MGKKEEEVKKASEEEMLPDKEKTLEEEETRKKEEAAEKEKASEEKEKPDKERVKAFNEAFGFDLDMAKVKKIAADGGVDEAAAFVTLLTLNNICINTYFKNFPDEAAQAKFKEYLKLEKETLGDAVKTEKGMEELLNSYRNICLEIRNIAGTFITDEELGKAAEKAAEKAEDAFAEELDEEEKKKKKMKSADTIAFAIKQIRDENAGLKPAVTAPAEPAAQAPAPVKKKGKRSPMADYNPAVRIKVDHKKIDGYEADDIREALTTMYVTLKSGDEFFRGSSDAYKSLKRQIKSIYKNKMETSDDLKEVKKALTHLRAHAELYLKTRTGNIKLSQDEQEQLKNSAGDEYKAYRIENVNNLIKKIDNVMPGLQKAIEENEAGKVEIVVPTMDDKDFFERSGSILIDKNESK